MAVQRVQEERDESLPPHSLVAEESVIGALLKAPGCIERIQHMLKPGSFYSWKGRDIWAAAVRLHTREVPVGYTTLLNELQSMGSKVVMLDLSKYELGTPTAAHVEHYASIINEMSIRRNGIGAAQKAAELFYDQQVPLDQAVARSSAELQWAVSSAKVGDQSRSLEVAAEAYAQEVLAGARSDMIGRATPWRAINKMTLGLVGANVYLQPARTQVGKSIIGEQLTIHFAEHYGPVYLASLEMGQRKLIQRAAGMKIGIPRRRVLTNNLADWERTEVARQVRAFAKLPIRTWTGRATIEQIMAACLRYQAEVGQLSLVVIDYVQLLGSDEASGQIREQVIAAASRGIKNLAEKLDVPVWAPVQVSREAVKRRGDPIPELHEMRESGALEQDADYVIALHRDDPQTPIVDQKYPGEAVVVLLKDRDTGNAGARAFLKWDRNGEFYTDADARLHTSMTTLPVHDDDLA